MFIYRLRSTVTLLFVLLILSGCAGTVDSVKSSYSNAVNFIKADAEQQKGNAAYQKKDYKAAFVSYQAAAEFGNAHGQFMLANMYLAGEGVQRNTRESFRWLKLSADNNYPPANYLMGRASLPKYPITAVNYFKAAARKEHGSSMHMLGLMYANGAGVEQSNTEALRWFRKARAQGFPVDEQLLSEAGIQRHIKRVSTRVKQKQSEAILRQKMVREIQEKLAKLGYNPGSADGLYGSKTKKAIQAFQQKKGLEVDGRATAELLEELNSKSWLPW